MSTRRRKKAIGKVVKLLNLATSSNSSEAQMALRHAESIIFQNGLNQGEIPAFQLCDRMMLFKVSWNGTPRYAKETVTRAVVNEGPRRFSEKPMDPNRAYANAATILDDMDETAAYSASVQADLSAADMTANAETSEFCQTQSDVEMDISTDKADELSSDSQPQATVADRGIEGTDMDLADSVDPICDEANAAQEIPVDTLNQSQSDLAQTTSATTESVKESTMNTSANASEQTAAATKPAHPLNREQDKRNSGNHDNVINAASAFRPGHASFKETLRNQYASSNPSVPFEDDAYWSKVQERLATFDESNVLSHIESIEQQLQLAKEALAKQRQDRAQMELEEQQERSERARIEQSFEEAIERAFQARARAYEAWEAQQAQIRVAAMRAEQEAQTGFEELNEELQEKREAFQQHLQLKEDYRAAKIMHEVRHHLSIAAQGGEDAVQSYETLVAIMEESGLSLRDLEFSDIRNKSLFIRLLERESARIANVHEREQYTEEMLDKFLLESRRAPEPKVSENPIEQVQRMLKSISGVGQYEGQKVIEQVLRLMGQHKISVRDLDYSCINKYSVFVCLINWEAEQIHSLSEREAFTAGILEEYVQFSLMNPSTSKKA
jgi:hypothetical protein